MNRWVWPGAVIVALGAVTAAASFVGPQPVPQTPFTSSASRVSVVCPAFFRTNLAGSLVGEDTAMIATAGRLIGKAEADADRIAGVVVAGIEARRRLILTDRLGRRSYWTKRLARPWYDRTLRDGAAKLARRG